MAISETVRDLVNYPSKTRVVTLDLQKVIPLDNNGDEIYVLNTTPATSVVRIGGGAVSQIFIREFKAGYAKSSGKVNAPFTLTSGNNTLRVSVDGSAFRSILLATGTGLTGENVASDLQDKITGLAVLSGVESLNNDFLNATCEFRNNRFLIVAGSVSDTYVGTGKSSVKILPGLTEDASVTLGFDIYTNSEDLSSKLALETVLTSGYTSGAATMLVATTSGLAVGEAFSITDGANRAYFVAQALGATSITISGGGVGNSFASGSVVQRIFERDPDSGIESPYKTIDDIMRFGLRSVANQIDFSL